MSDRVPETTFGRLGANADEGGDVIVTVQPTQVRRPWRATLRTVFAGIVAFAALLPFIVPASGLDPQVYPWLGGLLAIAAGVTRVMALSQVEEFLRRFLPFLAAAPPAPVAGRHVRG